MRGIDEALVAEPHQFLQAVIEQAGDFAFAVGIEVRAPDIANEQGIAREHANRAFLKALVIKHVGQAVVGVPGRFKHLQERAANLERVAFPRLGCILDRLFRVRPVPDLCASLFLQDRGA